MASKTTIQLLDDLDGGEAEETLIFGLDGRAYEIDLSSANAGKLRAALEPYASVGRSTSAIRAGMRSTAASARSGEAAAIRAWAQAAGYELGERGRIPFEIQAAYAAR
jgi:hypothetical protein